MKLFAEKLVSFPDPRGALDEGILDMSDDLRVDRLLEAYSFGIFPWPHQDLPTIWFSPAQRGILEFKRFHVPRSLQKSMRRSTFRFSFNENFVAVTEACSSLPRPGQSGTWITEKLLRAYREFHAAGYAQSLEVWEGSELVGGLYGVYVGGVFSGESMFFRRDDASKMALVKLVEFLAKQGMQWMDIQMVTPLLEQFGGHYVTRDEFLKRLEKTKPKAKPVNFKFE